MIKPKLLSNPWTYQGIPVEQEHVKPFFGFVYIITDNETGNKYIGKKNFWVRKAVKGKTRKIKVPSDWMNYFSSHEWLKTEGKKTPERFKREILHFCSTQGETNWKEIEEQVKRDVLYDDAYLNDNINREMV